MTKEITRYSEKMNEQKGKIENGYYNKKENLRKYITNILEEKNDNV